MSKSSIIGLKELRENTEYYIRAIDKGKSFTVVRRSKPIFRLEPVEEADDDRLWDTKIDLTQIDPHGVHIDQVIASLKRLQLQDRKKGHESARQKSR